MATPGDGIAIAPPAAGDLAALLRGAATRLATAADAAVLAFARENDTAPLRLRSAAGVPSPASARAAAAELQSALEDLATSHAVQELAAPAALGPRCAAGLRLVPIRGETRLFGALAIAAATPLGEAVRMAVDCCAESIAAQLDRDRYAAEGDVMRSRLDEIDRFAEEKSDEVLKLSEALFAQDIELLRSNERLGEIEKLKNDFIEKMSRELRTPLNSIIESIIAVLAGENDVLSEMAQQSLRRALDDGTAFLRTLQNILDLWRIKQGEMPVEVQDVNFREVVEEAIFSVQDTLGNNPVVIEKSFEEPLPKVRTDLAKVNQILFLLLDNAAKFTREGRIDISARIADGMLACEVKDTGIGICPDDQQFIFDEFYQVDELASTKYRGSGLGLALVRDLLRLLDGSIDVSSEVGVGSSFRFQIPVQTLG
jgi:signal transduction histidine kinase